MHEQIKAARIAAHMTQKELADLIGVSRERISEIENNKSNPSKETLEAIAEALGKYWKLTRKTN